MLVIEKAGLIEAAAPATTESKPSNTRFRARIIEAGQGSTAYYPEKVLEDYASVFQPGTHVYMDHPSVTEEADRPERSIRDLVGKFVSEAEYDDGALYTDIEFFSWAAPAVGELKDDIGLSIRAYGTAVQESGQLTPTLQTFTAVESVDLVTRAGAGGRLLEMLESARPSDPDEGKPMPIVVTHMQEATANEKREALNALVTDAYSANDYVWVRDFDDTYVWFEGATDDGYAVYQQTYSTINDVPGSLEGTATEVRAQTTYVPVSPQESATMNINTTTIPKESRMNEAQEATLNALAESVSKLAELMTPVVESLGRVAETPPDEETTEISPLEAANVLAASGLSDAGREAAIARVSESVTLAQAIEAQREYEDGITAAASGGKVIVEESDKPTGPSPFKKFGA